MEQYVECTHDGRTLRGMMHVPSHIGKVPMVILLHGFQDDRNEINFVHTELSRRLCDAGIASVRFDLYGSGESDGCFSDITVSGEIADAEAILAYVRSLDLVDPDRIAFHGTSLGGCVAAMTAGRHHQEIRALSTWCAATDLITNLQEHQTLCGLDVSDIETKGYADVEGLRFSVDFYHDALQLDPYGDAAKFDKHVNLVHGDQDATASCENSKKLKEIYGTRANLLIVKGAGHRFLSMPFREARERSALEFLKSELC
ncbi:MAG: alpha/beta hydrolase family protein [Catenisphaera adipataccumulans]|jgi:alpha/beta superfamily hydrolase|uniref:alpha/beta hydrolase family protein n=1 Tax=Catenisphaera adipataccumulans TaxID=700500 RepID=UPI003D904706